MSGVQPLRNSQEYQAAVIEIDMLLDADPRLGSADCARLEILSDLVEQFEDEHFPWEAFDGIR